MREVIDYSVKNNIVLLDSKQVSQRESKSVTIYFNKEKTKRQVIRPNESFNSDIQGLVLGITNGYYDSYEVN